MFATDAAVTACWALPEPGERFGGPADLVAAICQAGRLARNPRRAAAGLGQTAHRAVLGAPAGIS
jgi:hypothetical protein